MQKFFRFEVLHQSSKSGARVGRIYTPHGIIDTPNFVAVGTNGSIKCVDNVSLEQMYMPESHQMQLMFCNTFHLLIHPGPEVIQNAGGLHSFINRPNKPIITDSGGFQVFSLCSRDYDNVWEMNNSPAPALTTEEQQDENIPSLKKEREMKWLDAYKELKGQSTKKSNENLIRKIDEEGVQFKSYRNGSLIFLSPETSIQAQKKLGADIIIPFDELLPNSVSMDQLRKSLDRTHRWEKRSLEEHLRDVKQQAMYAVIHGGTNLELRQQSIDYLCNTLTEFDGHAIGGSLGKDRNDMVTLLEFVMPRLPKEKPNHVLGIGDLESIQRFISLGVDTFDSAYPTRNGRHGFLFTSNRNVSDTTNEYFSVVKIRNVKWRNYHEQKGIDSNCQCHVCKNYTLAYLHHLFKMNEPVFQTLASIHNLYFMYETMHKIRQQILNDEL